VATSGVALVASPYLQQGIQAVQDNPRVSSRPTNAGIQEKLQEWGNHIRAGKPAIPLAGQSQLSVFPFWGDQHPYFRKFVPYLEAMQNDTQWNKALHDNPDLWLYRIQQAITHKTDPNAFLTGAGNLSDRNIGIQTTDSAAQHVKQKQQGGASGLDADALSQDLQRFNQVLTTDPTKLQQMKPEQIAVLQKDLTAMEQQLLSQAGKVHPQELSAKLDIVRQSRLMAAQFIASKTTGQFLPAEELSRILAEQNPNSPLVRAAFSNLMQDPAAQAEFAKLKAESPATSAGEVWSDIWSDIDRQLPGWGHTLVLGGAGLSLIGLIAALSGAGAWAMLPAAAGLGAAAYGLTGGTSQGFQQLQNNAGLLSYYLTGLGHNPFAPAQTVVPSSLEGRTGQTGDPTTPEKPAVPTAATGTGGAPDFLTQRQQARDLFQANDVAGAADLVAKGAVSNPQAVANLHKMWFSRVYDFTIAAKTQQKVNGRPPTSPLETQDVTNLRQNKEAIQAAMASHIRQMTPQQKQSMYRALLDLATQEAKENSGFADAVQAAAELYKQASVKLAAKPPVAWGRPVVPQPPQPPKPLSVPARPAPPMELRPGYPGSASMQSQQYLSGPPSPTAWQTQAPSAAPSSQTQGKPKTTLGLPPGMLQQIWQHMGPDDYHRALTFGGGSLLLAALASGAFGQGGFSSPMAWVPALAGGGMLGYGMTGGRFGGLLPWLQQQWGMTKLNAAVKTAVEPPASPGAGKPGLPRAGTGKGGAPSDEFMRPWPKEIPDNEWNRKVHALAREPKPTHVNLRPVRYPSYFPPSVTIRNQKGEGRRIGSVAAYGVGPAGMPGLYLDGKGITPLDKLTPQQRALVEQNLKSYKLDDDERWVEEPFSKIRLPVRKTQRFYAPEMLNRPDDNVLGELKDLYELKPGPTPGQTVGEGKGITTNPVNPGSTSPRTQVRPPVSPWYARPSVYVPAGIGAGLLGAYGLYNWMQDDDEEKNTKTAAPLQRDLGREQLDHWAQASGYPDFAAYTAARMQGVPLTPTLPFSHLPHLTRYPGMNEQRYRATAPPGAPSWQKLLQATQTPTAPTAGYPVPSAVPQGPLSRDQITDPRLEQLRRTGHAFPQGKDLWKRLYGTKDSYLDWEAKNPGSAFAAGFVPFVGAGQSLVHLADSVERKSPFSTLFHGAMLPLSILPGGGFLGSWGRNAGNRVLKATAGLPTAAAKVSPLLGKAVGLGRQAAGLGGNIATQLGTLAPTALAAHAADAAMAQHTRSAPAHAASPNLERWLTQVAAQNKFDPRSSQAWQKYWGDQAASAGKAVASSAPGAGLLQSAGMLRALLGKK